MKELRLSIRTRLTAWYGGLFALAGTALLITNYVLVATPDTLGAVRATEVPTKSVPTGSVPAVPVARYDVAQTQAFDTVEDYRASALSTLLLQSVVALVVTVVLAVWMGWLLASRVLQPLHSITNTAHQLGADNLGRRINHEGPDDELKDLADT
ncbi:HAMP domain-containing protein, partial [Umezawaea endophytica]